ncbi:hypothetical protein VPH35_106229 [Triticum aestivum]|uniref:Uncharacterized protein n=1 Tax=Triticum urartu TaxID=4572 RepID=A0A8R7UUB4_TRIUA
MNSSRSRAPVLNRRKPAGRGSMLDNRSGGDLGAGARGEGVAVLLLVVAAGLHVHAVRRRGVRVRRLPVDERAQAEELVDGAGQPERAGRAVAIRVPGRLQQPLEQRVVEVGDGDDEPPEPVALLRLRLGLADPHGQPPLLHLPPLLRLVPLHDGGSSLAGGPTAAALSPSLPPGSYLLLDSWLEA